jgi:hypothetical protein
MNAQFWPLCQSLPKTAALYEETDMLQTPHCNFVRAGMINLTRHIANYSSRKGVHANCISRGGVFADQLEASVRNYTRAFRSADARSR